MPFIQIIGHVARFLIQIGSLPKYNQNHSNTNLKIFNNIKFSSVSTNIRKCKKSPNEKSFEVLFQLFSRLNRNRKLTTIRGKYFFQLGISRQDNNLKSDQHLKSKLGIFL